MRIVIDTNTIISAMLIENSLPQKAFYLSFSIGDVLSSNETLQELKSVFLRKKFKKCIDDELKNRMISLMRLHSEVIEVFERINVCRDQKDNKFLELAISGQADYIISGDNDLLVLNPFQEIQILTPKKFLERFNINS